MARLNVNGRQREFEAEPDTPLLWVLREQLGLTGTKYGCGVAQCGSCTVHVDGQPVRSCVVPVSAVQPTQRVVTIEGLSPAGDHALQKAWTLLDVPQCGYCQSGMLMAAAALLRDKPKPTDADIGYPIYRLEWQTVGSLQRRIRGCLSGVRAEPFAGDSDEHLALEVFLAHRAAGLRIETPAVRP
jgi:isoquinoline 1-oxidoreductase alpha subunit